MRQWSPNDFEKTPGTGQQTVGTLLVLGLLTFWTPDSILVAGITSLATTQLSGAAHGTTLVHLEGESHCGCD